MSTADAAFFGARGFGRRIGFGTRPTLLVVDYICGFTDPSLPLGSNLDAEVEQTAVLLDDARKSDVPVIYTIARFEDDRFLDAGVWRLKQAGITSLAAGTPAVEIDPRLEPEPGDQIVVKKYASAFFGTDMVSRLTSAQIDTVLIVGCTTSGCVRATAVDALQYGFRPMIVKEAVGDRSRAAHEQSLFDLDQKYADVVSAEAVLAYLAERRG